MPFGVLYNTHQLELWQVGVRSPEAERRLEAQHRRCGQWRDRLADQLRPYAGDLRLPSADLRQSWNCAVRISVKAIDRFDAVQTAKELLAKIPAQSAPPPPQKFN